MKKCHRNSVWNASNCFWSILHESSMSFWDSRKAGNLWGMMTAVGGVRTSIHQCGLAKGLGLDLGLLCFKGVREEIRTEGTNALKIGSMAFRPGQYTVHNSILVTDYLTKMGINTAFHPPNSLDLAPCYFWLFPSSEAVVMRQFRRWKRLWRSSLTRTNKRTSMGPCWKLLERYNECIAAGRDYFEGD